MPRYPYGRHARRRPLSLRHWLLALLACAAALITALSFAAAPGKAATMAPAAHQARAGTAAPAALDVSKSSLARFVTAARQAAARHAADVLAAHTYRVRSGDSISSVAVAKCAGQARDWTGIYAASRAWGWTGRNANQIAAGQKLYLLCAYDAAQLKFAIAAAPAPVPATVAVAAVVTGGRHDRFDGGHGACGDGDGDGFDAPCSVIFPQAAPAQQQAAPQQAAPVQETASTSSAGSSGSYGNVSASGYSGFEACVIARESGGNSQVMNSSGHYGLFQFSSSTWQAYGGNPADFGHASVSEQQAVFSNAMARGGQSNWSPYDGC